MKYSDHYYLEEAPIQRAIAHLSIPMMCGMSIGVIYNILNAFFIGLLHNTEMITAVTLGLPIFTILMAVGNIFGVGGGTYISRLLGEKEKDSAKYVSSFIFYGSFAAGVMVLIVTIFCINPIVHLIGAHRDSFSFTKNYSFFLLLGSPLIVANFAMEQVVRSEGAAKASMNGMFISTVASVIFDPIFIFLFHLNVAGAAISTCLANGVSLAYYAWHISRNSEHLTVSWKYFRISKTIALQTFKIGISEFLLTLLLIVSTLMLNHYAVLYSDDAVAGFGIALRIVQLPEFLCMGLVMGAVPLLAFTFAAKNKERYKQAMKQLFFYIGMLVLFFSGVVFVFKNNVLALFSHSSGVIAIGTYILTAMLISTIFNGFTGFFTSIFQASGKAKQAAVMSVTHGFLFVPIIILGHTIFGLHGVIWSLTITEFLTFLVGLLLFVFMEIQSRNNQFEQAESYERNNVIAEK